MHYEFKPWLLAARPAGGRSADRNAAAGGATGAAPRRDDRGLCRSGAGRCGSARVGHGGLGSRLGGHAGANRGQRGGDPDRSGALLRYERNVSAQATGFVVDAERGLILTTGTS